MVDKHDASSFARGIPRAGDDRKLNDMGIEYYRALKDVQLEKKNEDLINKEAEIMQQKMMIEAQKSELSDMIAQIKIAQKVLDAQSKMAMLPGVGTPANGLPPSVGLPANGLPPLPVSGSGNIPASQDMGGGGMPTGMPPVVMNSAPPYM